MKVALIVDPIWLLQELPTLRRLAVGLVGEQIRVVRVVPDGWAPQQEEQLPITGPQIAYGGSPWQWLRHRQLRGVQQALREQRVDLLHVLDGSLQRVGMALAESLDVPLICSVWSGAEVERMRASASERVVYAPATPTLLQRCRDRLGSAARLEVVAPGVYSNELQPPLQQPAQALSCVLVGSGPLDRHYRAFMQGIAQVKDELPHLMYFFYTVAGDDHTLWQYAERLDLLDQINFVPFDPGCRPLMVQADVVVQPQPSGRVRTLILEAMGAGRPVIAAADPLLDYLVQDRTARLLAEPGPAEWADAIRQLVGEPDRLIELGRRARAYVQEHHAASSYVGRTIEIYERTAVPRTLPFDR